MAFPNDKYVIDNIGYAVCISDRHIINDQLRIMTTISIGKTYKVLDCHYKGFQNINHNGNVLDFSPGFLIVDDVGNEYWYSALLFKTLKEFRDEKLTEILS